jgi:hypothetical protein
MKKIFLFLAAPLMFFSLSAQISQKEADNIVQQRLKNETKLWSVYAKDDLQTGFEMTTSTGEILELNYSAWVYYVSYAEETFGKYLIVKENSGNLLEVNAKNDAGPDDLTEWRAVAFEIPFEDVSWDGTNCYGHTETYDNDNVVFVNSLEEWKNYTTCANDIYPEIDFSIHTLILARGTSETGIWKLTRNIQQLSSCNYRLDIDFWRDGTGQIIMWGFSLVIDKISEGNQIELIVTYYY